MRYLVNQHTGELEGLPSIPIASSEEKDMFLKGDGTYAEVDLEAFTGATDQNNGGQGTVPAPLAGDQDKVLQGNGSWGKKLQFDVVIQNGKYGYINSNNEFVSFMSQADLSDVTGTLSIDHGGTGATTAAAARTNLGLATVASSGSYTDLSDKPTIPTNTNQLINGAGFITADTTKLPLAGGTMTGTINSQNIDNIAFNFRPNSNAYYTTLSYQTAGNEALVAATKNNVTSFIFINGEDSITNHDNVRWQSLTPALQIKQNSVSIGALIANGVTPTYKLAVSGTLNATGAITQNGTAVCLTNDSRLTNSRTPTSHASTATTYGVGNASNYGHVKVSDTYSGTANTSAKAANSIAASQWALQTAYANRNSPDASGTITGNDNTSKIYYCKMGKNVVCHCKFKSKGTSADVTYTGLPQSAGYLWLYLPVWDGSPNKWQSVEIDGTTIKTAGYKSTTVSGSSYDISFCYVTA